MASVFYILKLLIRKNIRSHIRLWWQVLLELIVTYAFFITYININRVSTQGSYIRQNDEVINYEDNIHLSGFSKDFYSNRSHTIENGQIKIYYTPDGPWQSEIAKAIAKRLNVLVFASSLGSIRRSLRGYSILCGIQFHSETTTLPAHLNYSLIFPQNIESESSDNPERVRYWKTRKNGLAFSHAEHAKDDKDVYYSEGFLQVQNAIYLSFMSMNFAQIKHKSRNRYYDFNVHLRQMPYPINGENLQITKGQTDWVENLFFCSYLLPAFFLTYFLATEYSSGVHEHLITHDVPRFIHWVAHYIVSMLRLQINCHFICLLSLPNWSNAQYGVSLFQGNSITDYWVLAISLSFFHSAFITFIFLTVVIMKNPKKCIALLSLILLTFRSAYLLIYYQADQLQFWYLILSKLFFMNNLSGTIIFMNYMASRCESISWDTISIGFSIYLQLIMLTVDTLLHLVLVWYVMKIRPNIDIEPKKWWFFLDCRREREKIDEAGPAIIRGYVQNCSPDKKVALNCIRVCREWNNKMIVSNVTFKSYEGEISCLVGHKGGGLTLIAHILGGLIKPTTGVIRVYGFEHRTPQARSKISMCPTQNCFFEMLTALEYIDFVCKVRGIAYGDIVREIVKWKEYCKFCFTVPIKELSYDDQRILSLICCFCVDSRVIVMFQPTLKMSPQYKMMFWGIMRRELAGRSVVVVSQNMDEVAQVGNRIGIMAFGAIKCYGTPYFLRKRMLDGYRLSIITEHGCDREALKKILKVYMPRIGIEQEAENYIMFIMDSHEVKKFTYIWRTIWEKRAEFKVKKYFVSSRPLDELYYLKINRDRKHKDYLHNNRRLLHIIKWQDSCIGGKSGIVFNGEYTPIQKSSKIICEDFLCLSSLGNAFALVVFLVR